MSFKDALRPTVDLMSIVQAMTDINEQEQYDLMGDAMSPVRWNSNGWLPGAPCERYLAPWEAFQLYVPALGQVGFELVEPHLHKLLKPESNSFPAVVNSYDMQSLLSALDESRDWVLQSHFMAICYPLAFGLRNAILEIILASGCDNKYELAYRAFDLTRNTRYRRALESPLYERLLSLDRDVPHVKGFLNSLWLSELKKKDFPFAQVEALNEMFTGQDPKMRGFVVAVNYLYTYEQQERLGHLTNTTFSGLNHELTGCDALYALNGNVRFPVWAPGLDKNFRNPFPTLLDYMTQLLKADEARPVNVRTVWCLNEEDRRRILMILEGPHDHRNKMEAMKAEFKKNKYLKTSFERFAARANLKNYVQMMYELELMTDSQINKIENPLF